MLDAAFTADVIEELLTGSYLVTRHRRARIVDGVPVESMPEPLQIRAVDYPASGRDLQRLPEERHSIATRIIFTTTELLVGGQGAPYEADLVTLPDGKRWEVQQVETWPGYFRAIVQAES